MVVIVVVVVVMVVGYCGAVFVVVAMTHVIKLIESDSFIISFVYSLRGGGCGGGYGVVLGVFFLMVVVGYWWWCGGESLCKGSSCNSCRTEFLKVTVSRSCDQAKIFWLCAKF